MLRQSFVLAAIGLALGLGACQRAAEAPRVSAPVVLDQVALARTALAAQQWAVAAEHLRAALSTDPGSLFLHSNLAICATWLDLKDEAIREFEWVVANAPGDSEEAKIARRWLAGNRSGTQSAANELAANDPKIGDGRIHGIAAWGEPLTRYQVFLVGLPDSPNKEFFRRVRTDYSGNYMLTKLPAGSYRLTDALGAEAKWRLKVTVEAGQDLALDLTQNNSVQRRDDFAAGK
jgi:hypothetical protein